MRITEGRLVDRVCPHCGGPDLTREEALEHPDLKYVWWVADEAMAQDRRARWMLHWLYATPARVTQAIYDGREQAETVARDADGGWELAGRPGDMRAAQLHQALDRDQSLLDVLDLEPGQRAQRRRLLGGWKRGAY
jgi:hypothetical protein